MIAVGKGRANGIITVYDILTKFSRFKSPLPLVPSSKFDSVAIDPLKAG